MISEKSTCKPQLIFIYDYFYPGYKAGGPIQSLSNLVVALQDEYTISVITSCCDLHGKEPYTDVNISRWNTVTIPGSKREINVYYAGKNLDKNLYSRLFKELKPDVVYFNNIYSQRYFLLPLRVLHGEHLKTKVVICPRGMLQKGALAIKPVKKKIYLHYLQRKASIKRVTWHATSSEEAGDIKRYFPLNKGIAIAANVPKIPYRRILYTTKKPGGLRLVYLSLIAEKKNLFEVLKWVKASDNATLDIYGPVTDEKYWTACSLLIDQINSTTPNRINYKADVKPANVQKIISRYDAMILLTHGENFGHALYESLSVGRPVITSYYTPWINLQQQKAGWNIDIDSIAGGVSLLKILSDFSSEAFNEYCVGAHQMAVNYYARLNSVQDYKKLF